MKLKWMVLFGAITLSLSLVGCSKSEVAKADSSVEEPAATVIEEIEEVETTVEEVVDETDGASDLGEEKMSYSARHPDVDPDIEMMFGLYEEYSESAKEFLGFDTYQRSLYGGDHFDTTTYIDMFLSDDGQEDQKPVLRLQKDQFSRFVNHDELRARGAILTFTIAANDDYAYNVIGLDTDRVQANFHDGANDSHKELRELATDYFEQVYVYKGGVYSDENYLFYKHIPLNDGYVLQIRLNSDGKYAIKQNFEEIKHMLDTMVINPVLLGE